MPRLRRPSRICGTAAAASSRSTVMRTSSEPARASAATCAMVPSISAVSVLVIDCTTIGAPPPTATLPTMTCVVLCRALGPATSFCGGFSGLFMASRISGFGDIHQGDDGRPLRSHPKSEFFVRIFNRLTLAAHGGRGDVEGLHRYQLYRTGIAGLKGDGAARLPVFSCGGARRSIGKNNGRPACQGATGSSPPRNSPTSSTSPICGCSIARPISNLRPPAARFPISPCPDGTRSRPGIFPARIFWTCRANSPIQAPSCAS